jgi:threonine aldolase
LSKSRYVSAQLLAYLDNDLWLTLANHANRLAQRIGAAAGARLVNRQSWTNTSAGENL